MFFLFVTLWNDEVCDNGNAVKQCNFQNNYGVIAYRKVCSCAPIFNFFCGPTKFSDLGGRRPTFLKARTVKFGMRVRSWDSFPQAKFYKINC